MNIRSDTVFANQCDETSVKDVIMRGNRIRMVSTTTRGVGKNRNISLLYAEGEIMLFSDDDMYYTDTYEEDILKEFERYPEADAIVFNIKSNSKIRKPQVTKVSHKLFRLSRLPYGAPRLAIKKESWEKSNIWFTTLFGGGARYTSGEDSVFLNDLKRAGLKIYVSNVCIGTVDMANSCWFKGRNREYYFNKGAFCAATHPNSIALLKNYYCLRLRSKLSFLERRIWFEKGVAGYKELKSYADYNYSLYKE